jgi:hypothetical protein
MSASTVPVPPPREVRGATRVPWLPLSGRDAGSCDLPSRSGSRPDTGGAQPWPPGGGSSRGEPGPFMPRCVTAEFSNVNPAGLRTGAGGGPDRPPDATPFDPGWVRGCTADPRSIAPRRKTAGGALRSGCTGPREPRGGASPGPLHHRESRRSRPDGRSTGSGSEGAVQRPRKVSASRKAAPTGAPPAEPAPPALSNGGRHAETLPPGRRFRSRGVSGLAGSRQVQTHWHHCDEPVEPPVKAAGVTVGSTRGAAASPPGRSPGRGRRSGAVAVPGDVPPSVGAAMMSENRDGRPSPAGGQAHWLPPAPPDLAMRPPGRPRPRDPLLLSVPR